MKKILDKWATDYRNIRLVRGLVLFLLVVGVTILLNYRGLTRKTVSIENIKAELVRVEQTIPIPIGIMKLDNGTEVKVSLIEPLPKAGDMVPLQVIRYSDGSVSYWIDRDRWLTGEP